MEQSDNLTIINNARGGIVIEVERNSRGKNYRVRVARPVYSDETLGGAIVDTESKIDALVARMDAKYGKEDNQA